MILSGDKCATQVYVHIDSVPLLFPPQTTTTTDNKNEDQSAAPPVGTAAVATIRNKKNDFNEVSIPVILMARLRVNISGILYYT